MSRRFLVNQSMNRYWYVEEVIKPEYAIIVADGDGQTIGFKTEHHAQCFAAALNLGYAALQSEKDS